MAVRLVSVGDDLTLPESVIVPVARIPDLPAAGWVAEEAPTGMTLTVNSQDWTVAAGGIRVGPAGISMTMQVTGPATAVAGNATLFIAPPPAIAEALNAAFGPLGGLPVRIPAALLRGAATHPGRATWNSPTLLSISAAIPAEITTVNSLIVVI